MIGYFSATGNSAWAAQTLADQIGDIARPISEIANADRDAIVVGGPGQVFGLVFPIHAWRPPRVVIAAARRLRVADGTFVVAIATMGGFCGDALTYLSRILPLDSAYSLRMPNNYVIMSDREAESTITATIELARLRLTDISTAVRARRPETNVRKGPLPSLVTATGAALFTRFISDKKFYATASCTGCGECVRLCPLHNISLVAGRPRWHGNCMHCMACIQHCPTQSIEYGRRTRNRTRYTFPA